MLQTTIPFSIEMQGDVTFSYTYGYMAQKYDTVTVFHIDMNEKYNFVGFTPNDPLKNNIPTITFFPQEKEENDPMTDGVCCTEISFPDFPGWEVQGARVAKYTCAITLVDWRPYWEAQGL